MNYPEKKCLIFVRLENLPRREIAIPLIEGIMKDIMQGCFGKEQKLILINGGNMLLKKYKRYRSQENLAKLIEELKEWFNTWNIESEICQQCAQEFKEIITRGQNDNKE